MLENDSIMLKNLDLFDEMQGNTFKNSKINIMEEEELDEDDEDEEEDEEDEDEDE
jgi:hypothetical protein